MLRKVVLNLVHSKADSPLSARFTQLTPRSPLPTFQFTATNIVVSRADQDQWKDRSEPHRLLIDRRHDPEANQPKKTELQFPSYQQLTLVTGNQTVRAPVALVALVLPSRPDDLEDLTSLTSSIHGSLGFIGNFSILPPLTLSPPTSSKSNDPNHFGS